MSVATPDAAQAGRDACRRTRASRSPASELRTRNCLRPARGRWACPSRALRDARRRSSQPVGGLRRQQQMVDADAVLAVPAEGLEVPERVVGLVRHGALGIDQAHIEQRPPALGALGPEQRIAHPFLGESRVDRGGDDVEVAEQDERLLERQPAFDEGDEPVHPAQLVGELVGLHRIAVGQIDAADPHHAALGREHAFDQPRLLVAIVAGQAARHLVEAVLRQDCNAVPAFLAEGLDIVAQRLDLEPRELPRRRT